MAIPNRDNQFLFCLKDSTNFNINEPVIRKTNAPIIIEKRIPKATSDTSHFKVVREDLLEKCHFLAKCDLKKEMERKSLSPKKNKQNSKTDKYRKVRFCSRYGKEREENEPPKPVPNVHKSLRQEKWNSQNLVSSEVKIRTLRADGKCVRENLEEVLVRMDDIIRLIKRGFNAGRDQKKKMTESEFLTNCNKANLAMRHCQRKCYTIQDDLKSLTSKLNKNNISQYTRLIRCMNEILNVAKTLWTVLPFVKVENYLLPSPYESIFTIRNELDVICPEYDIECPPKVVRSQEVEEKVCEKKVKSITSTQAIAKLSSADIDKRFIDLIEAYKELDTAPVKQAKKKKVVKQTLSGRGFRKPTIVSVMKQTDEKSKPQKSVLHSHPKSITTKPNKVAAVEVDTASLCSNSMISINQSTMSLDSVVADDFQKKLALFQEERDEIEQRLIKHKAYNSERVSLERKEEKEIEEYIPKQFLSKNPEPQPFGPFFEGELITLAPKPKPSPRKINAPTKPLKKIKISLTTTASSAIMKQASERRESNKFDPNKIVDSLCEDILDDCLNEVANDIFELTDEVVEHIVACELCPDEVNQSVLNIG
ncbi:DgyrCDS12767 [Dimorphilus gyrociliatus]|uniref:DgyrCDS12767 n=1 Tax=Dimorphilus gyrociliatus TaxID=2664684 RepID=A0A7I8W862_9ANNE|nr:DgyrCDS12767 [Dimorphilus gyrociliatus]